MGDLEEFIKLKISDQASITLTWEMLDKIDIDADTLRKAARGNSRNTVEITPLSKKLCDLTGIPYLEDEDNMYYEGQIFILTCNNNINGASAMLFDDVLDDIAMNCDVDELTILPSSIHEVLIYAGNMERDKNEIDSMITDINEKEVSKFERLSNHAYHYFR